MNRYSYSRVMERQNDILRNATGIDYSTFQKGRLVFDYEGIMATVPYTVEEISRIQRRYKVGGTPLHELENVSKVVRSTAKPGYGARIFIKDEACNASGSFKARRASIVVHEAKKLGYEGITAGTSGNYGAAIAALSNMHNLKAIILQEVFDSRWIGQPEILEKGRSCTAYGAEVIQLTVGPELFYMNLRVLEATGYFNGSLYVPLAVAGVETLGYEIGKECEERFGKGPDVVLVTHAGGGNITGTTRGLRKAGCVETKVIGASVDLKGLHMASDNDFNKKSFTTGHTGFSVPFLRNPDRTDVPRNAARPMRYLDRFVTVTQGEVFYATEMLARIEGLERGPAGNTSLAAAVSVAREMKEDEILVVQETEYTGAGKHPTSQLTFARERGVEIRRGDPRENIPGKRIVIPENIAQIRAVDMDLDAIRKGYIRAVLKGIDADTLTNEEIGYLADEANSKIETVENWIRELEGEKK
ncbi:MAG: 2-amino-4-oxopentanoate thiolase subunit OrtB [Christensenella sp.]|nr:2-amino-4-oxopentanoate thiolase subunit OrtB [Christensenella sp.]